MRASLNRQPYLARRTPVGVQLEVPNPIEADPILGASADGGWVFALDRTPAASDQGVIGVRRFDPDGELFAEVEIPYQPLAIPADAREGLLAAIRASAERMSTAAPQLGPISADEVVREVRIPDCFPPVREAHADEEGRHARQRRSLGDNSPLTSSSRAGFSSGRSARRYV